MITIELKDAEVSAVLARLAHSLTDMTPVMQEIGEQLVYETGQRFELGLAPDGTTWAPKSQTTLDAYARRGESVSSKPLFGPSGVLHSTISSRAGADFVEVGSGAIYAAVMQFGAAKGAFGADTAGHPIPWGNIPARPFLGISDTDRANIIATVSEWLVRAAGSAGA